jgi:hypothetical protein
LVGQAEGGVVFVGPSDGEFESSAGVEAGGSRVGIDRVGGPDGCFVDGGPFGLEEGEVAQSSPRKARCWREAKSESRPSFAATTLDLCREIALTLDANRR